MSLAELLRDVTVKRKMISIAALSLSAAMPFAMSITVMEEWFSARTELKNDLLNHARILSGETGAALLFSAREEAQRSLGMLAGIDYVEYAQVLDRFGKPYVSYLRQDAAPPESLPMGNGEYFTIGLRHAMAGMPIMVEGEQVGSIHIYSNLSPVYKTMASLMATLLAAMLGSILLAAALIARLHPLITRPIADLIAVMERVSSEKNYALRADSLSKDELGVLGAAFNDVLEQMQLRDTALRQYREHLEEEVALRTVRLTEAQRIAHLGNWEWDIANNKLDWSFETYRLFGLTPQRFDATYEAFMQTVHPDDRRMVDTKVMDTLEQGGSCNIDHRILLPDGTVRHVHEQAEVSCGEDGRPHLMRGTVQDITERKQAEERIRKLNEELEIKVQERTRQLLAAQDELVRKEKLAVLGQVAGSVGHELRNPLGVMSNAVYFLQTVLTDADDITREYLGIIKDEIAVSERIISDLLDAVRTKPPRPEAVRLAELVGQTLRKCNVPPSVAVKLDIPAMSPLLRVDPLQIHQVFRNLISNAVEAMPDGGALEIRADENREKGMIVVSVKDSGTGIAPEVMDRLFQPLFTTKARGIGLGLVVVKNLVRANGGSVEVRSEPGEGALFSVALPASVAEAT